MRRPRGVILLVRFSLILLATVVVLGTAPVLAADDPRADALIQQGLDLRREGKPAEALELFQRAHAIAPSPRTFGQLGLVETSLQHWADADLHLSMSLANPDDAWIRKNRAFLEQALATSKHHIGELVVDGPAGAEVFVGGKSVGTLPAVPTLHLVEGAVSISATAPGFKAFDQTVVIRPGARTPVAIALTPIPLQPVATTATASAAAAASPAPLVTAAVSAEPGTPGWHAWVGAPLASIGAGLLAWGIVWVAIDGKDDCGVAGGSACGRAYNTKTWGWILAGVGAAAVATGGVIFFSGRGPAKSDVAVGLAPSSLLLQGRF
jgi:hypothetical protein